MSDIANPISTYLQQSNECGLPQPLRDLAMTETLLMSLRGATLVATKQSKKVVRNGLSQPLRVPANRWKYFYPTSLQKAESDEAILFCISMLQCWFLDSRLRGNGNLQLLRWFMPPRNGSWDIKNLLGFAIKMSDKNEQ
ncbi:hypothetical protein [Candidatus Tisiphia endosymbiont of Hybos culiciformis]|uniref:hypothetical protein n=1 Tax=Candidatus Tisiphia endosymbiont of Hybos culiciformis TaxID=3139331 RepID=UPI003CCADA95